MPRMYRTIGARVILAVMLAPLRAVAAPPMSPPQHVPDRYARPAALVDIGHGRVLDLRCTGHGPRTVLLEAGAHADASTWFRVQPLLARHAHVCAYDRAGYGFSSMGPLPRDLDADVADLHALIHHAGLTTPLLLVGHSLGSNIVRRYADRYPAEVGALVLIDPPAQDIARFAPAWAKDEVRLSLQRFAFLRRCRAAAERHQLPSATPTLRHCLGHPDPLAGAHLQAVERAHRATPTFWRTVVSELHDNTAVFQQPVSAQESHGSMPLIVLSASGTYADALRGDRKGLEAARDQTQARIVATSSRGRLVRVAHTSHDIQLDRPRVVVEAVQRALHAERVRRHRSGWGAGDSAQGAID